MQFRTLSSRPARSILCALLAAAAIVGPQPAAAHGSPAAALAFPVAPQGVPATAKREPKTAEELVRVEVGVVGEAKPGATVRIAATFTIHQGWHIYWLNPGESGMPTQITLELPAGCMAAKGPDGELAVDFPAPQVFAKGETTIGYERSVTISVPVTLPKELPAGGLAATVRSRWLVCKEACLLGQNEAKVDLAKPVAAGAPIAKALAESLARVPQPAPADWKFAIAEVTDTSAVLSIDASGADGLRFIPLETPGVHLASGFVADAKGAALRVEIALSRESSLGKPLEIAGIVVVGKNGPARAFRLPVPSIAK